MLLLLVNIISLFFQTPDKLTEDIDRYLSKELSGYEKIEFSIVKVPEFKKIIVLEDSHLNVSGKTAYVPVKLTTKENKEKQTFLTVSLKLYKTVFVAKERIDRKKPVSPADFEISMADIAGARGTFIPVTESLAGFRTKTTVRKGDFLIAEFLEKEPVIFSGDRVKAYFVNGTVSVDFFVNSRQDGVEGDIIRVVTHDNKQYKARVVDSKNVIIIE